jgi:hypothetical protein
MFRSLDLTLSSLRYDANLRLFARLHDDGKLCRNVLQMTIDNIVRPADRNTRMYSERLSERHTTTREASSFTASFMIVEQVRQLTETFPLMRRLEKFW